MSLLDYPGSKVRVRLGRSRSEHGKTKKMKEFEPKKRMLVFHTVGDRSDVDASKRYAIHM